MDPKDFEDTSAGRCVKAREVGLGEYWRLFQILCRRESSMIKLFPSIFQRRTGCWVSCPEQGEYCLIRIF